MVNIKARMHDSSWILLFRHANAHQWQGWPAAPRKQPQQPKQRARQLQDEGTRERDKTSKVQGARIAGIECMAGLQASAQQNQNQIGGR